MNHTFLKEKDQNIIQSELSDEQIKQAAKEYAKLSTVWHAEPVFIDAINWYKKQIEQINKPRPQQ
jgi:hypothetical protein